VNTPSQTVGPFLHIALDWDDGPHAVAPGAAGAIRIGGFVLDGAGDPVPDGLVETWQADPDGRFDSDEDPRGAVAREGFRGFARCPTADDGAWHVVTLKPGRLPAAGGDGLQAPHLDVSVFARGLLHRVVTRVYFADEERANAQDAVLAAVPEDRRATLLARPDGDAAYRFDIHLQGPAETVFFEL